MTRVRVTVTIESRITTRVTGEVEWNCFALPFLTSNTALAPGRGNG